MKKKDSTAKDARIPGDPQDEATPKAERPDAAMRELTDEQFAAVVGGGKMAPDSIKKT
jgi:hypothetical protein